MATVKSTYKGDLRTEMTHLQSGVKLVADAPTDNHGKGESFSPTDMVAAALGACVMTIIGIASKTHGFDVAGAHWETTKIMAQEPRRIGEIVIDFHFPRDYDPKVKRIIEAAGRECPVARSLSAELKQTLHFHYGE